METIIQVKNTGVEDGTPAAQKTEPPEAVLQKKQGDENICLMVITIIGTRLIFL